MTGRYVCLAGPDGVGKSTLTSLLSSALGPKLELRHWRPGVLPALGVFKPGADTAPAGPHDKRTYGRWASAARLVYYWLDFVLGHVLVVRPVVRTGGFFVLERGWWDMRVDPRRYRLHPRPRLHRVLSRVTPRQDAYLVLEADADVIASRKAELTMPEIERQLGAWHFTDSRLRRIYLDAGQRPTDLAADALEVVAR